MNLRTIEFLTDPMLAPIYWPAVITAVGVAIACAVLSPVAVLKRLSFVGQGVSHAAFGGVGLAFMAGITGAAEPSGPMGGLVGSVAANIALLAVVSAFCIAAALGMGWLTERSRASADTSIGIVLSASMALGFILIQHAGERAARGEGPSPPGMETVLFGSILGVDGAGAVVAWMLAAGLVAVFFVARRSILFWAFDEGAAAAFGFRVGPVRLLFMSLLAVAIVATMKLAGLVLATALLVLPGATALQLTERLGRVMGVSVVSAVVGVVGGIVLSFEMNWQPGPAVVASLSALFALAWVGGSIWRSRGVRRGSSRD